MNEKPLTVKYDEFRDVLTVNGIAYSGVIFRAFAGEEEATGFQPNVPFSMVKRDETITLSLYSGGWWAWKALGRAIWRFVRKNAGKW